MVSEQGSGAHVNVLENQTAKGALQFSMMTPISQPDEFSKILSGSIAPIVIFH